MNVRRSDRKRHTGSKSEPAKERETGEVDGERRRVI